MRGNSAIFPGNSQCQSPFDERGSAGAVDMADYSLEIVHRRLYGACDIEHCQG